MIFVKRSTKENKKLFSEKKASSSDLKGVEQGIEILGLFQ